MKHFKITTYVILAFIIIYRIHAIANAFEHEYSYAKNLHGSLNEVVASIDESDLSSGSYEAMSDARALLKISPHNPYYDKPSLVGFEIVALLLLIIVAERLVDRVSPK